MWHTSTFKLDLLYTWPVGATILFELYFRFRTPNWRYDEYYIHCIHISNTIRKWNAVNCFQSYLLTYLPLHILVLIIPDIISET